MCLFGLERIRAVAIEALAKALVLGAWRQRQFQPTPAFRLGDLFKLFSVSGQTGCAVLPQKLSRFHPIFETRNARSIFGLSGQRHPFQYIRETAQNA
jgi:hypothetical protein